jgi:hypothetical protein
LVFKFDEFVKSQNPYEFVIPAKAGIQLFQFVLGPGACPRPDPGFAGVTIQETFYEFIRIPNGNQRDEPLALVYFSYRNPSEGKHLGILLPAFSVIG